MDKTQRRSNLRGSIYLKLLSLSILASTAYSFDWCENSEEYKKIKKTGVICNRTDNVHSAQITCKVFVFLYALMAIVLIFFLIIFLKMRKK